MKIYSIHFNRPDYVKIQYDLSLKLGYQLIVVNNGCHQGIHDACTKNNIDEISVKNIGHNSHSHGNAINQLFKICPEPEDCGIIDHDIFLLEKIQFSNRDIIALNQSRGLFNYFWPGFLFWKKHVPMKNINFTPNGIGDTGANTNSIYSKNEYKISKIKENLLFVDQSNKIKQSNGYSELYQKNRLLAIHAINASTWHSQFSKNKTDLINSKIQLFLHEK